MRCFTYPAQSATNIHSASTCPASGMVLRVSVESEKTALQSTTGTGARHPSLIFGVIRCPGFTRLLRGDGRVTHLASLLLLANRERQPMLMA